MGQGDQGCFENPTLLPSFLGGLGTVSTNVQGSVIPRDTSVRFQGINGIESDNSWAHHKPTTEAKAKKYVAFRRAFQARKYQEIKQLQQKNNRKFNVWPSIGQAL